MSTSSQLSAVLDHIDKDFDKSLERLFTLLRIKSISADPAFNEDCKKAADHLAADIASIGFAASRMTSGSTFSRASLVWSEIWFDDSRLAASLTAR